MKTNTKHIDILCVGEVLIDFIGHQSGAQINNTSDYRRYLGGSPTNVAMNCHKLGLNSAIVSSIGNDGLGEFVLKEIEKVGVNTNYIKKIDKKATSVIFVSKSETTPDFIPYRDADFHITEDQITKEMLLATKIFHTTCFALSKDIAQTTILNKAKEAYELGCQLSIDINYSEKIWDSSKGILEVLKEYCQYNPLVKVSEDDMFRLFHKTLTHQQIFDYFHNLGVQTICLTLGAEGVILSQKGKETIELPAIRLEKIADVTGAGDAFWSGFLTSYTRNKPMRICLESGLKTAAIKLQNIGGLPDAIQL